MNAPLCPLAVEAGLPVHCRLDAHHEMGPDGGGSSSRRLYAFGRIGRFLMLNFKFSLTAGSALFATFALFGCDTGFGAPCEIPKAEEFQRACTQAPVADAGNSNLVMSSQPSCAVTPFPGCETQTCLVYRGASAFCSERCTSSSDCEGDGTKCLPLLGDADTQDPCAPTDGFTPECYCVPKRKL